MLDTAPEEPWPAAPAGRTDESCPASRHAVRWSRLLLGCVALVYLGTCFTPVIFDDNEGLYAGAVREMHQSGDWLVPMSNGFPRVQKPPLVYWTMLSSTSLLGENEFALRLPNALATWGWIVATYLLARRLGGERFGRAAALVLASMLGVWVFNHLVQPEPFLACFLSLALWSLTEARLSRAVPPVTANWYLLFWLFLALGTMSKGLHGALWPLGTVLLTMALVPTSRAWLRPVIQWRGAGLFVLVVAPWYLYMGAHFPGFFHAHFVNEQLGASLNTRYPPDAKQLPIWQFYGQHLLFWLPWTLLVPAAFLAAAKRRVELPEPARDAVRLLQIGTALILFSLIFSTRQDYYSMSCWGFIAILLALPWVRDGAGERGLRALILIPCLLVALVGFGSLGLAAWTHGHLALAGTGTAAPIEKRDTFMDAITGISPALWQQFLKLLWFFGGAAAVAGSVASLLVWRRRYYPALLVLGTAGAVPLILGTVGFTIMSPYFSLAENARAIDRDKLIKDPQAIVACEARPNTASSLLYYLHERVHWVNAPFDNQYAQQVLGLGRDYYLDEAAFLQRWRGRGPVYFIVEESRLDYWRARLGPGLRTVNKSGTRLVLCNR